MRGGCREQVRSHKVFGPQDIQEACGSALGRDKRFGILSESFSRKSCTAETMLGGCRGQVRSHKVFGPRDIRQTCGSALGRDKRFGILNESFSRKSCTAETMLGDCRGQVRSHRGESLAINPAIATDAALSTRPALRGICPSLRRRNRRCRARSPGRSSLRRRGVAAVWAADRRRVRGHPPRGFFASIRSNGNCH